MSMEFDKRQQRQHQLRKISQSKTETRRGSWLMLDYFRSWEISQTRFLEDLILT